MTSLPVSSTAGWLWPPPDPTRPLGGGTPAAGICSENLWLRGGTNVAVGVVDGGLAVGTSSSLLVVDVPGLSP